MDVEDPINPLADDAALDFASLFTSLGVRGSFCLTGEKCRVLLARGRSDVLSAFAPHCLGLHTDTHSFHPTTMELLAPLSWSEGCSAAFDAESRGFSAFVSAFGRSPVFWGGAGNTWSPEITFALRELGISAYVYALTGSAVHRFNGVFALPQSVSISEDDWAAGRYEEAFAEIAAVPSPWVGVFVGHPTRFRYSKFWDWPYAGGVTPSSPSLTEPLPQETYERSKANLSSFLLRLKEDFQVIGVDEALQMPWRFRSPTPEELVSFRDQTAENLRGAARWPIHRPDLDVSNIIAKTLALAYGLEIGE